MNGSRVRGMDTHEWERVPGAMQMRCANCGRRWRPSDNPDHIGFCRFPSGSPATDQGPTG